MLKHILELFCTKTIFFWLYFQVMAIFFFHLEAPSFVKTDYPLDYRHHLLATAFRFKSGLERALATSFSTIKAENVVLLRLGPTVVPCYRLASWQLRPPLAYVLPLLQAAIYILVELVPPFLIGCGPGN